VIELKSPENGNPDSYREQSAESGVQRAESMGQKSGSDVVFTEQL